MHKRTGEPLPWFDRRHQTARPYYVLDETTGCWLWQRYIATNGYGRIGFCGAGRTQPAHRFYFERYRDVELPQGVELHHTCGNRACVNPDHLEIVTHEAHMRVDKSPLTWDDVREIRASLDTSRVLAERFGVSAGAIRTIRANQTWHDPDYQPHSWRHNQSAAMRAA